MRWKIKRRGASGIGRGQKFPHFQEHIHLKCSPQQANACEQMALNFCLLFRKLLYYGNAALVRQDSTARIKLDNANLAILCTL